MSILIRGCLLFLLGPALAAQGTDEKPARRGGDAKQPLQASKCNEVPAHPFDMVAGRPSATSVTLNVLCHDDAQGFIAYGTEPGKPTLKTPARTFKKGEAAEIIIAGLKPDTRVFYQLDLGRTRSAEGSFHTARPPGSPFSFTVTADPHLDNRSDPALYQKTLAAARAGRPDFHIDLGDTFMTEKHVTREDAAKQYLAQRYYFGQLCQAAPLFLVLGNHDGETPRGRGRNAADLAVWSNTMRKRYFPNPVADAFYQGNATPDPSAGLLQDYYAWVWGDALFVVLDPYWFSQSPRDKNDHWSRSLGTGQYQWLKRTLETRKAKFKFVFTHHLVGGADAQCRGGAEAAPFYEWGGKNADGSDGFQQNRAGWTSPIHPLLVRHHVNIVFHGHDHFYAKQELDGIIYQEVPQPSCPGNAKAPRQAAQYGYLNGTILGGSGHLRVGVAPAGTVVEYIRSDLTESVGDQGKAAGAAHRYTVAAP